MAVATAGILFSHNSYSGMSQEHPATTGQSKKGKQRRGSFPSRAPLLMAGNALGLQLDSESDFEDDNDQGSRERYSGQPEEGTSSLGARATTGASLPFL